MAGFSSTDNTIAFFGGSKYNPTMAAAFGTNSGSVLTHQLWQRVKEISSWRRIRHTLSGDTFPNSWANRGPVHVAYPFGIGWSNVSIIRLLISWSSYRRLIPGRGTSDNPSRRFFAKRLRHFPTVVTLVPKSWAMDLFSLPRLAASITLLRKANRCSVLPDRDHDSRVNRSSGVNSTTGANLLMQIAYIISAFSASRY